MSILSHSLCDLIFRSTLLKRRLKFRLVCRYTNIFLFKVKLLMRCVQSNLYSLSGWQKVDKAGSYQIKVSRVGAWPEPKGDRTWSEILAIAYSWYSQRFSTSQQSWHKSFWALFEQLAFLMQTELFADYLVPWIELDICENVVGTNLISSFCRTILLLASIDSSRATILGLNKLYL